MNQINTLLISVLTLFSIGASAQWTEVEWAQLDGISNIDFADDDTGYAQMHLLQGFTSSFEKTEDGGQTWNEVNIPVNSTDIQDMNFYAPGVGAFVARSYVDGEILTQVYSTSDDGANWENISPDEVATGYGMSEIQMLDQNTIFFVIDDYFYRTVNGGDDWTSSLLPAAAVSVNFSDADHGVVGTWDGTFLYSGGMMATDDGGVTWNETFLEIGNSVIGVVDQFNETSAYAAPVKWGANGHSHFYKTVDNGLSWTTVSAPQTDDDATLTGFDFRNENYGVVTLSSNSQFYIYNTVDGGETWNLQSEMAQTYFSDLDITPNSGYLVGEGGLILRLDSPLSLNEFNDATLSLYPNPAHPGQNIQWNALETFTQIRILDISGKIVFKDKLVDQNSRIPELQKGIYFVSLENELMVKTIKVMID